MNVPTYTFQKRAEYQRMWKELLAREEAQFEELSRLDGLASERTDEKSKALRHYWSIVNGALWMFVRCKAQAGLDLEPFPTFLLARLANLSEELSNGNVLPFIENVKGQGRRLYRTERHDIAYAVLYVEAAKQGEIADRSPVKTIGLSYGVTSRTVQGWCKSRDALLVGVPRHGWSPERLKERMEVGAKRYRANGRGIGMTADQWPTRR